MIQVRRLSSASNAAKSLRLAIVGAGPSGPYAAHRLLKDHSTLELDIFDALPTPYGLVRYGVAPDHPEVKNVTSTFDAVLGNSRVRFFGNVKVGDGVESALSLQDIRKSYSATILAYGTATSRSLGIPGENLQGVLAARDFVGWYNGSFDCQHLTPNLQGPDAVIIGHGNVALDVARVLLSPPDLLAATDISSRALAQLRSSGIKRVFVVGRRGPLEVSFTIKELREMSRLPGVSSVVSRSDLTLSDDDLKYVEATRPRKRLTELMIEMSKSPPQHNDRAWHLQFNSSPISINASPHNQSTVSSVTFACNTLIGPPGNRQVAENANPKQITLSASSVISSIGYKGVAIDASLPFNSKAGTIQHEKGKVSGTQGLYCAGWIKTGPTGVILSSMTDAFQTAATVLADLDQLPLMSSTPFDVARHYKQKGLRIATFSDWKRVSEAEAAKGKQLGKVSEKVVSTSEFFDVLDWQLGLGE